MVRVINLLLNFLRTTSMFHYHHTCQPSKNQRSDMIFNKTKKTTQVPVSCLRRMRASVLYSFTNRTIISFRYLYVGSAASGSVVAHPHPNPKPSQTRHRRKPTRQQPISETRPKLNSTGLPNSPSVSSNSDTASIPATCPLSSQPNNRFYPIHYAIRHPGPHFTNFFPK